MKKQNTIIYHVVFWLVFIVYEVSAVIVISGHVAAWPDYVFHYILNIGLFYLNAHFVMPTVFKSPRFKYLLMLPAILAEFCLYLCVNYLLNNTIEYFGFVLLFSTSHFKIFLITTLWRIVYITGLSIGYWFGVHFFKSMKKVLELNLLQAESQKKQVMLEKEVIQSENAFLQAQINPHLLFNTLNYIYNSVESVSEKAGNAILLLSDVTRYSLQRVDGDGLVPLPDEIHNIRNIVKLNQLRFNSKLNLQISLEGEFDDFMIAPLILISFVENVFKHADLRDPGFPAHIKITASENELYLKIVNKKLKRPVKGTGIGVLNSKTRLMNKYPGNHLLTITDDDDYYELNLQLSLDHAKLLYC